jgi:hypothetical protein
MSALSEDQAYLYHDLLLLKVFTIPQVLELTCPDLDAEFVRTEIANLEQLGLVVNRGAAKGEYRSDSGEPVVMYQLTPELIERYKMLEAVQDFYQKTAEESDRLRVLESEHYFIAQKLLHEYLKGERVAETEEETAALLNLIAQRLEYARQEEEVGEPGTESIARRIDKLHERAIEVLSKR